MYYDPNDLFYNYHLPSYYGNDVAPDDAPDDVFKGCLISGLILLGFIALLIIAYFILKRY